MLFTMKDEGNEIPISYEQLVLKCFKKLQKSYKLAMKSFVNFNPGIPKSVTSFKSDHVRVKQRLENVNRLAS
jgi:hypothetical protein